MRNKEKRQRISWKEIFKKQKKKPTSYTKYQESDGRFLKGNRNLKENTAKFSKF